MFDSCDYDADVITMPYNTNDLEDCGHCILLIGYDDDEQVFTYIDGGGNRKISYEYILNEDITSELLMITNID